MAKILVVEDEKLMTELLLVHLQDSHDIYCAQNGASALEKMKQESFELVILDVMMPFVDGFEVCKRIREVSTIPILMLTARSSIEDRVYGLQLGADDYLVKPFDFEELKARVYALLRRNEFRHSNLPEDQMRRLADGRLVIHTQNNEVRFHGQILDLTAKEYKIVALLSEAPNRIFSREAILEQVWEDFEERDLRAVDSHIKNIRNKFRQVESDVKVIKTIWGMGYRFEFTEANDEE